LFNVPTLAETKDTYTSKNWSGKQESRKNGQMTINNFEDIRAWQAARELTNLVYEAVLHNQAFRGDYVLSRQIQDAAGGVMHNIAEGFGAGYNKEFLRFLRIARRSATEVQSQLYLALDRKYISQEEFDQIYNKATKTKKLINAFITYLKNPKPGPPTTQPPDDPTT
jgi:four helix bundle protein